MVHSLDGSRSWYGVRYKLWRGRWTWGEPRIQTKYCGCHMSTYTSTGPLFEHRVLLFAVEPNEVTPEWMSGRLLGMEQLYDMPASRSSRTERGSN